MLAEFGLLGAFFWIGMFGIILISNWRLSRTGDTKARSVVLLLIMFAIFQFPHDVFYQRIWWFALGVLLIRPSIGTSSSQASLKLN
jgi:O-antigen ligase